MEAKSNIIYSNRARGQLYASAKFTTDIRFNLKKEFDAKPTSPQF